MCKGKIVSIQANKTAFERHIKKSIGNKLCTVTLSAASSFDVFS